ncbi:restriction endonuclease subunit S [Acinetobacter junii]|uniref:restriction endonuclease subunit S n=1 Tax=Acinetobacter junii TaxID=40215 RepID=UPI00403D6FE0
MAKYQKYVEYKDSGVRWLGAVPSHWIIAGFKKYLESTVDYRGKTPEKMDEGVFLVTARNIKNGIIDYSLSQEYVAFKDYDEIMSRGIPVLGDVLFTTEAPLGEVAQIDNVNIALAQRIIKFRGKKDILDNTYLKYFILSQEFQDSLMTFATGSTALGIKAERIGYLQQCIPPIHEQTQIANFLDHETAKIDHLIEKQHQLIELLKEKHQAVISHAVTKGLDPNVPMKDSGVEWLGKVPEHWVVKSYRLASRIYRGKFGHRPRNDPAFYDGDYPFIQTGDVARAGKYITSYSQTLNEKGKEVSQLFPKGTLMMAIAANIGDIAILGFEAYAPDSVVGFKPNNDIDLEFLRYSFIAALPALEQTSTQSTQANLNVERIGAVKGTFPSLQEQCEIVGYLDNLLEQYRNLVKIAENAISLMQERRTALISAAVTGKIDVRHWQAPTLAEADTELSA